MSRLISKQPHTSKVCMECFRDYLAPTSRFLGRYSPVFHGHGSGLLRCSTVQDHHCVVHLITDGVNILAKSKSITYHPPQNTVIKWHFPKANNLLPRLLKRDKILTRDLPHWDPSARCRSYPQQSELRVSAIRPARKRTLAFCLNLQCLW